MTRRWGSVAIASIMAFAPTSMATAGCGGRALDVSKTDGGSTAAVEDATRGDSATARDASVGEADAITDGGTTGEAEADGDAGVSPIVCAEAGAEPTDAASCSPDGWCQVSPVPQTNDLNDIWGSGPSDVWAVGAAGTILHWDGSAWSMSSSGGTSALTGVWGSSSTDVWVVGPNDVLHRSGSSWAPVKVPGGLYWDVGGTASDDVWLVGESVSSHWDGHAWTQVSVIASCFNDGAALAHVWATGPDDVWATGVSNGIANQCTVIVHWDGTAWSTSWSLNQGEGGTTQGVWGSATDDVWVAASMGTSLLHWNGGSWTPSVTTTQARAVSGASSGDVWTVGSGAAHWNGTTWAPSSTGVQTFLNGVWVSPCDIWAVGVGGTILRRRH